VPRQQHQQQLFPDVHGNLLQVGLFTLESFGDLRRIRRDIAPCSAGDASSHEPIHKR
jgi:hypothetical protein